MLRIKDKLTTAPSKQSSMQVDRVHIATYMCESEEGRYDCKVMRIIIIGAGTRYSHLQRRSSAAVLMRRHANALDGNRQLNGDEANGTAVRTGEEFDELWRHQHYSSTVLWLYWGG